jgi:hypothetical protein
MAKPIFTYLDPSNGKYSYVLADNLAAAEKLTKEEAVLVIQGTARSIHTKRTACCLSFNEEEVQDLLKKGSTCSIVVEVSKGRWVSIENATYVGSSKEVPGYLAFKKNVINFWAYLDSVDFTQIDEKYFQE